MNYKSLDNINNSNDNRSWCLNQQNNNVIHGDDSKNKFLPNSSVDTLVSVKQFASVQRDATNLKKHFELPTVSKI